MLGLLGMTFLSATTIKAIRQFSYRVFFITHLIVALALPPAIWFHVPHGRAFMADAFLFLIADLAVRRFSTVICPATIDMIPGTSLIKAVVELPPAWLRRFAAHPASYAYLSVPQATCLPSGFISNPFTVASVNEETGHLTFIARRMHGPTTQTLARLAGVHWPNTKATLRLDGPYGAAAYLPDLAAGFDKVLLVAGGVGMTFIMPLFEHITKESPATQARLIWAARDVDEVKWSRLVGENSQIRVFLTGRHVNSDPTGSSTGSSDESNDLELDQLEKNSQRTAAVLWKDGTRPDLQEVVYEFLGDSAHDRCAIVVCGPAPMARELRKAVGIRIQKGRDVWFHSESFCW